MTRLRLLIWIVLISLIAGHHSYAQTHTATYTPGRVLSTTYTLEVGAERAFNTYLSPLSHSGWTMGLSGEWSRSIGNSLLWSQDIGACVRVGLLENPAHNAAMNDLDLALSWRALRSFTPLPDLCLGVGAGALFEAGMLYLPRNANNPVAARAYLGISLEGKAAYTVNLWGKKFRLLESLSLPSLGAFFSPHYGQSYYEIYLGNTSGLVRCGWWGNRFALSNHFALEIPVCRTRLRIGYRLDVQNSLASAINSRITTHSVTLGINTEWLNITRSHE